MLKGDKKELKKIQGHLQAHLLRPRLLGPLEQLAEAVLLRPELVEAPLDAQLHLRGQA